MSNVRALREHAAHQSIDTVENRLRMRGFWPAVERIAREHFVLPSEIISKGRKQEIYRARCALYWHISETTQYSSKSIGALFDLDHNSTLKALAKHRERMQGR